MEEQNQFPEPNRMIIFFNKSNAFEWLKKYRGTKH